MTPFEPRRMPVMTAMLSRILLRGAQPERLRDEAAHCRRLAAGAVPLAVAHELERFAAEYERAAGLAEGFISGGSEDIADAAD